MVRYNFKGYYMPTPVFWRKVGDALMSLGVTISTTAILAEYKWTAVTALLLGTAGKILTGFFTDVPTTNSTDQSPEADNK